MDQRDTDQESTDRGGTARGRGIDRRDVLALLGAAGVGSLAGCSGLFGDRPAVDGPSTTPGSGDGGGGGGLPDLSGIGAVYVGRALDDLPDPERSPAVGITGEGNFVHDGSDWLGPVGVGSRDHPANPSYFAGVTVDGAVGAESLVLDGDTFDIRAYGAKVDGRADDLGAVQRALDRAAEVAGTVLVPAGTTLVSDAIELGPKHSGVTLRGVGYDSHVRLSGGHTENHYAVLVDSAGGESVTNLTIENIRFDGNRAEQVREHGLGIQIAGGNGRETDRGILVRNVWSHDWMLEGIGIRRGGVTVRDVRVWNNRLHGIGIRHDSPASNLVSGVYAWDNGYYGIDVGGGRNVVTDFVLVNNGWGFKTGGGSPEMTVFANGSVVGNDHFGFQMTGAVDVLVIDNVECRDNGSSGFRFDQGGTVLAGNLVATGNGGDANVHVAGATLYADSLFVEGAEKAGLLVTGEAHVGHVIADRNGGPDVTVPRGGVLYADGLGGASRTVEGTLVEGRVASVYLSGEAPDARDFETGTFIYDTNSTGRVWLVVDGSKRDGAVMLS